MQTLENLKIGNIVWVYTREPNRRDDKIESANVIEIQKTYVEDLERVFLVIYLQESQNVREVVMTRRFDGTLFHYDEEDDGFFSNMYVVVDKGMLKLMKYLPYHPESKDKKEDETKFLNPSLFSKVLNWFRK